MTGVLSGCLSPVKYMLEHLGGLECLEELDREMLHNTEAHRYYKVLFLEEANFVVDQFNESPASPGRRWKLEPFYTFLNSINNVVFCYPISMVTSMENPAWFTDWTGVDFFGSKRLLFRGPHLFSEEYGISNRLNSLLSLSSALLGRSRRSLCCCTHNLCNAAPKVGLLSSVFTLCLPPNQHTMFAAPPSAPGDSDNDNDSEVKVVNEQQQRRKFFPRVKLLLTPEYEYVRTKLLKKCVSYYSISILS